MALAKEFKVEVLEGDPITEDDFEVLKKLIKEVAMRKLKQAVTASGQVTQVS